MRVCHSCGEESPEKARFCAYCGTSLEARPVVAEGRRTVTILFSDIVGSTALGERTDAETVRRVVTRVLELGRTVVERHGGIVERFVGDALMAVFGLPEARDDDALRAVLAATELHERLDGLNTELERQWGVTVQLRTGVNTGEVATGDPYADEIFVTGDAVNVAARLEQAAAPMEIVIGEHTRDLVERRAETEPLQPLALKGKAEPVPAYRVVHLLETHAELRRISMVGRERESTILHGVLDDVIATGRCRLVAVTGPPGIGKTRLVEEFLDALDPATVVMRGSCLSYEGGGAYHPLLQALRRFVSHADAAPDSILKGISDLVGETPGAPDIVANLASLLGLSEKAFQPEQARWAFRRFVERVSAKRPLVVFIDDLHWAEPPLLELVGYLAERARSAGILLVGTARPGAGGQLPEWAPSGTTTLELAPIDAGACEAAIRELLGGSVDQLVLKRVCTLAGGNPLFVQAIVALLTREGSIKERDGSWCADDSFASLSTPPSIQSILGANIDALEPAERDALERASIIGEVFYRDALAALSSARLRESLPATLDSLERRGLVEPTTADFAGQSAFRFTHGLLRDVAAQRLRRSDRAYLHERFAGWLESQHWDSDERTRMIGYHLEQAYRHLGELGPIDERGTEIGQRGAALLAEAARTAWNGADDRAAGRDFKRAAALLPVNAIERAWLLLDAAKTEIDLDPEDACRVVHEARRVASLHEDRSLAAFAELMHLNAETSYRPAPGNLRNALSTADRAIELLRLVGDHSNLCYALVLLAYTEETLGLVGASMDHAEHAYSIAVEERLPREQGLALLWAVGHFVSGQRSAPECIARADRALAECEGIVNEAVLRSLRAKHLAKAGRIDEARRSSDAALGVAEELGTEILRVAFLQDRAQLELNVGDWRAAEDWARPFIAEAMRAGTSSVTNIAADLACALAAMGRDDEALEAAALAESETEPDDLYPTAIAQSVRALVVARSGDPELALQQLDAVETRLRAADLPEPLADVLARRAEVLLLAGRNDEARASLDDATALYERLGVSVSAERSRERAATIAS